MPHGKRNVRNRTVFDRLLLKLTVPAPVSCVPAVIVLINWAAFSLFGYFFFCPKIPVSKNIAAMIITVTMNIPAIPLAIMGRVLKKES